ncbi:MAG: acyltransferase family protein [Allorhizobium sp.]
MTKLRHISSLDGLRGLAAFVVVLSHIHLLYPEVSWWPVLNIGSEAVALFFALSGFLMVYLYGAKPFNRASASEYLVHRFARIYPVYLVSVLFVIALSAIPALSYLYPISGVVEIVRHVIMLGSTGVFWSIPPETQFYVFFLLIWLWLDNPQRYASLAAVVVCLLAVIAYFDFPGPGILLPSKIAYFLAGSVVGRLYARGMTAPGGIVTGVAALALLAFFFAARLAFPEGHPSWGVTSALTAALIIHLIAAEPRISAQVLGSTPLRFLGRISFSLYLFHVPVMFLVATALPRSLPAALAIAICLVLATLFASLSQKLIEAPSRRFIVAWWKRHGILVPALPVWSDAEPHRPAHAER